MASTGAPADADPFAIIDPDELEIPGSWRVKSVGPPLVMESVPSKGQGGRLTLPVHGVDAFGYEARVQGGTVDVYVDDVLVVTHDPGSSAQDLALTRGAHVIAWDFVPDGTAGGAMLTLQGAGAVLAPVTGILPRIFVSECGGPATIELYVGFALPLLSGGASVSLDGEAMASTVSSTLSGISRSHRITAAIPVTPPGEPAALGVAIEDAAGKVWDLVEDHLVEVIPFAPLDVGPHGWVYDLQPTLVAGSPCMTQKMSSVALTLDGVTRAVPVVHGYAAAYRMPTPIAFDEEHTYTFAMTLLDGSVVTQGGSFRGGLDVMEFDVSRLALVFGEAVAQGQIGPLGFTAGEIVFANLAAPEELPPVSDHARRRLDAGNDLPLDLEGAHLRAVFAPLGISCERAIVSCSPYGGNAPGFDRSVAAATLDISAQGKTLAHIRGAGQFAAASRMSALLPLAIEISGPPDPAFP